MIKITNATKQYSSTLALNNVNLEIKDSGIYCLLGRNGAGKTTLLKSLAGHINLSDGQIHINGKKVSPLSMSSGVTFIESQASMFNMRIKDLISFANEISDDFDLDFSQMMLEKFQLNPVKKYKQLSFGMRTMVGAILSLSNNNPIVILDEPVLGFDPIMRDKFYNMLEESMIAKPRIMIVSTHLIDEIAKIVEKIIIIDNGKILDYFSVDQIDEKAYAITGMTDDVEKAIKGLNVIARRSVGGFITAYVFDKRISVPSNCTIQSIGLQDYFISLVGGDSNE